MDYILTGPYADAGLLAAVAGTAPAATPVARADGPALSAARATAEARARLDFHAAVHAAERHVGPRGETIIGAPVLPLGGQRFGPGPLAPRWSEIWREAAAEIAECRGRQTPAAVRGRLVMIWCRAASRLRARAAPRPPLGGLDRHNLTVERVETPHAGFFLTRVFEFAHDLFGGGRSPRVRREVMVMADAVTVLPWDPVRDRVLVIEQVRAAPLARDDPSPWLPEPVAGRIDPGDTPEATAHRETLEEARLELSALHRVADYYPSTGAFSEYLHSFVGIADLPDDAGRLGGLDSEAEDIRGHVMDRADLMARIAAGHAPVGPLILSAFWLEANAARLRGSG